MYVIAVLLLNIFGKVGDVINSINESFGTNFTGLGMYFVILFLTFLLQWLYEISSKVDKIHKKFE